MINIGQFQEIELRTATIVSAERVPETDKLMRLEVDAGDEEPRQLVAGIAEVYAAENLPGRRIVIVANLEPATIRGVESQGMLLAASVDGRPTLVSVPDEVPGGSKVS